MSDIELGRDEQALLDSIERVSEASDRRASNLRAIVRELRTRISGATDRGGVTGPLTDAAYEAKLILLEGDGDVADFMVDTQQDLVPPHHPKIGEQLEAYNRGDLDAFCDCFANDVVLLVHQGGEEVDRVEGMADFRACYEEKFNSTQTTGIIVGRKVEDGATIEDEVALWTDRETGVSTVAEVTVTYEVNDDGKISFIFLHNMTKRELPSE